MSLDSSCARFYSSRFYKYIYIYAFVMLIKTKKTKKSAIKVGNMWGHSNWLMQLLSYSWKENSLQTGCTTGFEVGNTSDKRHKTEDTKNKFNVSMWWLQKHETIKKIIWLKEYIKQGRNEVDMRYAVESLNSSSRSRSWSAQRLTVRVNYH